MPYIRYRVRGSIDTDVLSASAAFDRIFQLENLEDLDLSGVASSDRRGSLAVSLAKDSLRVFKQTLRKLNLEGNFMGARGIMHITEEMDRECVLEEINLGRNCLCHVGCSPLSDAIKNQLFLKSIIIPSNNIGDRGASVLAAALIGMQSSILETFDASDNGIGERGSEALAGALHRFNSSLKKINLERNEIGSRGTMHLAGIINETSALQEMYLGSNNIGAVGAAALADALRNNTEIRMLHLSCNDIGDRGTTVLLNALHHHEKISELVLFQNNIGQDGAVAIASLLIANRSLSSMNIAANHRIGNSNGGMRLVHALEAMENRALTYFHVQARDVGGDFDVYNRIKRIIRRNRESKEAAMMHATHINLDTGAEQDIEQVEEYQDVGGSNDGEFPYHEMENVQSIDLNSSLRTENYIIGNRMVRPSAPPVPNSGDFSSDHANVFSEQNNSSEYTENSHPITGGSHFSDKKNANLPTVTSPATLKKSYSEMECKICYDNKMDCVLLPCSHMCCCTRCGNNMAECPICRSVIAKVLPIYKV
uniref:RING-type domain-containing protein n=1 Tax=Ditylum brightwellii TaxID=49249 RepID=A0A7S4W2V8_9STRA|mmetsp:Transcript_28171/g.37475  ORF Transcript_28171/g.37475 Transcript_28171/m.37475 type:complete len:538 (-) Transcript_28171:630-2243(-)